MIGIAGQLDGIAALFSHVLSRHFSSKESIVALGREASCGWNIDRWRLGSMTSERDTSKMLHDLTTVYYFCLTPPPEGRTKEEDYGNRIRRDRDCFIALYLGNFSVRKGNISIKEAMGNDSY